MRVCKREKEKNLTYDKLRTGDVFRWLLKDHDGCGSVAIKTGTGHTYIATERGNNVGYTYPDYESSSPILRYPNACISLGDPE